MKLLTLFLGLFLFIQSVLAGEPLNKPNVTVGLYPNRIYDIKIKDDSYAIDFTVWFRWQDKKIDPINSFKLRNGKIETSKLVWKGKVEGTNEFAAVMDVTATFPKKWDMKRYPFDRQFLEIQIEENVDETDLVLYEADNSNMSKKKNYEIPGWRVSDITWETTTFNYDTNYGYTTSVFDKTTVTTGFRYYIQIEKEGLLSELKLIVSPLVILFLLCFGGFLKITNNDTDRVNLGITSLFASVAVHFVVIQALPESNDFSILELIVLLTIFATGWFSALTFLAVHYLKVKKDEVKVRLVETINFYGVLTILVFVLGAIFYGLFMT